MIPPDEFAKPFAVPGQRHGVWMLSDLVLFAFHLDGDAKPFSVASLPDAKNGGIIIAGSFSKNLLR